MSSVDVPDESDGQLFSKPSNDLTEEKSCAKGETVANTTILVKRHNIGCSENRGR
jgi:hypothetical protein